MSQSSPLQQTLPETKIKLFIATGCPGSGWESVLPILAQSGLERADSELSSWLEEVYQASSETSLLDVRQPLQSGDGLWKHAVKLLTETPAATLLADSRHTWLLQFWAARLPQTQFLLFYTRPDTALAHALKQGMDAAHFLDGWEASNRQLLTFMRRHRNRVLLLDADAAIHNPQAFTAACNRFGFSLQSLPEEGVPASDVLVPERLIANHLIAAFPQVQALLLELGACAMPLGEVPNAGSTENNQFLAWYQQTRQTLQDHASLVSVHKDITEENEQLLMHLLQVQEELERYLVTHQMLEHEISISRKQNDELRLQLAELKDTFLGKVASALYEKRKRSRRTRKMKARIKKQCALINASGLFDNAWYLAQYPDVADSDMSPVEHYLWYGAAEGRNPAPGFDTHYYLEANPDVAAAGMNPLVHYINKGRGEGRRPSRAR